ncbi:MAG: RNA methyltransferase [Candidatus Altiarchaeota archaeon]
MIQENFHIILVEPKYEGNIGSVARVMKNFGFTNLTLVNPPELGSEARQKSMHALEVLQKAGKVRDLAELQERMDYLVATTAKIATDSNPNRSPIMPWQLDNALKSRGKIGLVFGREDYGLLNEELELCDLQVTIPANPEYPTLNLAQSVGVILYELSKDSMTRKLDRRKFREIDGERKRVLLENIDGMIDGIYDREYENNLAKKTIRQLIGRAFVSGREAQTLIGLFRRAKEGLGK